MKTQRQTTRVSVNYAGLFALKTTLNCNQRAWSAYFLNPLFGCGKELVQKEAVLFVATLVSTKIFGGILGSSLTGTLQADNDAVPFVDGLLGVGYSGLNFRRNTQRSEESLM